MKRFAISVLVGIVLTLPIHAQGTIHSVSDALRLLPALPTVEQLGSQQAKEQYENEQLTPFAAAVEQSMLYTSSEYSVLTARMSQARNKKAQRTQATMQQYNKNVEAGLMPSQQEMMQILMSSGINLEKATEQQIMDVVAGSISQKWGVSKEEYLKIVTMAQRNPNQAETYLKANHPALYQKLYATNAGYTSEEEVDDPRNERFGQIGEELDAMQEQMNSVVGAYDLQNGKIDEVKNTWEQSSEYTQVEEIEKDLWTRVEQWITRLDSKGSSEVPYPGWWTEKRQKENALIDQWNKREAEKWLTPIATYHSKLKELFDKVAALEAENEDLSKQGDQDNFIYLMNKQKTLLFINQLNNMLVPYRDAIAFPNEEHKEEKGAVALGKG